MSNKSAGESGDVTLGIELAGHIDDSVLNKCEVEKEKEKRRRTSKRLKID